jgi:hypothetical protein
MTTLTFSQALLQAEAQARSTLDQGLHGRLSCAVSLVKDGHVFQADDGTWTVDSQADDGNRYRVNGSCDCADYLYNKPAYCKHQLAMFLARRAHQLMSQPPAPVVPQGVEPWPDNDPEATNSLQTDIAPPAAEGNQLQPCMLPEAPASANVRVTLWGREVQITLRDTSETRLLQRLEELLAQVPVPQASSQPQAQLSPQQHNAAAMHKKVTDFCQIHNVQMQRHENAKGVWYSHYSDGKHCKGR